MNELQQRILFAIPAAAAFIALMWFGDWYFRILVLIILAITEVELVRLFKRTGTPSNTIFSYLIAAWVFLYPILPFANELGLAILLIFISTQVFSTERGSFHKLISTLFAGIYVPLGFLCLLLIRETGTQEQGFALALTLILMIWGSDAFAYFGGKAFGKRPLAPKISPNKTKEGLYFGFLGGLAGLAVSIYVLPFESPMTLLTGAPLILLIGYFGPVGDLLESRIKRKAKVKDSSKLIPGHGGFFDRFDALIPSAMATYAYLQIMIEFGYVVI